MLLSIFSSIFFLLGVRATLLSTTVITVPVTCRESIALQTMQLPYAYVQHDSKSHATKETELLLTFQSTHAHEQQGCMHACIIAA